jgi:phage/plasmid-like protein (TIGR03299 family)
MAHKIDQTKSSKGAFVSYLQKPWHGLGTVVDKKLSVKKALELGGLDFQVEKKPNVHIISDKKKIVSEKSFFTYRTDTDAVLGAHVGKQYTPLQNHDALSLVDEYVTNGGGIIETVGALENGCITFLCVRAPKNIMVTKNDAVEQYVIFSNAHDGSRSIQAYYSPVRVVCWNTLQAAEGSASNLIKVRHSSNVLDNAKEAMKILGIIKENTEQTEAAMKLMVETKMNQQKFMDYVGNIFLSDDEIKRLQIGEKDVVSTQVQKVIADVLTYAENGIGQKEAKPGTAWWAYNAVTGYFANVKEYKGADKRMDYLLNGDGKANMEYAFDLALYPDRIQTLKQKGYGKISDN